MSTKEKRSAQAYYDAVADTYQEQYDPAHLHDVSRQYPANYFRMQLLIDSFVRKGLTRVIEVGVGEGTPLVALGKAGLEIWGFDISEEMVKKAQQNFTANNFDPNRIFHADIREPASYKEHLPSGEFDGLMAMGVMPHVEDDDIAMHNMANLVRPGGSVFIEFRNKLFSLFTFNRYTAEFILDDLLRDVDPTLKEAVRADLEKRLRMDMPPVRDREGDSAPGYDAILSKFHNPFEVPELFRRHEFTNIELRWYHYHPAMPYLSEKNPELFRKEAIRLEGESSGWKGYFLCSAFVIEAVKAG